MKNNKSFLILISFILSINCFAQNSDEEKSSREYTGPIINMHLHAYNHPNPLLGEALNPITGEKRIGSKNLNTHKKETFEQFDKNNIVMGMVSTPDGNNKATLYWKNSFSGKVIIGQRAKNPDDIDFNELQLKHKNGEFDLFGEIAPSYEGILPTDPRIVKLFDFAEELDVPIGYHLFPDGPPGAAYFAYLKKPIYLITMLQDS